MSHQRSQITAWAEQALPAGMRRVPSLTRTTAGPGTPANPRPAPQGKAAKDAENIRAARDRRIALAVAARFNAGEQPGQGLAEETIRANSAVIAGRGTYASSEVANQRSPTASARTWNSSTCTDSQAVYLPQIPPQIT